MLHARSCEMLSLFYWPFMINEASSSKPSSFTVLRQACNDLLLNLVRQKQLKHEYNGLVREAWTTITPTMILIYFQSQEEEKKKFSSF